MPDGTTPEPRDPNDEPDDRTEGRTENTDDGDSDRGGQAAPRAQSPHRDEGEPQLSPETDYDQLEAAMLQTFEDAGLGAAYVSAQEVQEKALRGEELTADDQATLQSFSQALQANPEAAAQFQQYAQAYAQRMDAEQQQQQPPPQEETAEHSEEEAAVDTQPVSELAHAIDEVRNANPVDADQVRLNNDKLAAAYQNATDPEYVAELQKKAPVAYQLLKYGGIAVLLIIGGQLLVSTMVAGMAKK